MQKLFVFIAVLVLTAQFASAKRCVGCWWSHNDQTPHCQFWGHGTVRTFTHRHVHVDWTQPEKLREGWYHMVSIPGSNYDNSIDKTLQFDFNAYAQILHYHSRRWAWVPYREQDTCKRELLHNQPRFRDGFFTYENENGIFTLLLSRRVGGSVPKDRRWWLKFESTWTPKNEQGELQETTRCFNDTYYHHQRSDIFKPSTQYSDYSSSSFADSDTECFRDYLKSQIGGPDGKWDVRCGTDEEKALQPQLAFLVSARKDIRMYELSGDEDHPFVRRVDFPWYLTGFNIREQKEPNLALIDGMCTIPSSDSWTELKETCALYNDDFLRTTVTQYHDLYYYGNEHEPMYRGGPQYKTANLTTVQTPRGQGRRLLNVKDQPLNELDASFASDASTSGMYQQRHLLQADSLEGESDEGFNEVETDRILSFKSPEDMVTVMEMCSRSYTDSNVPETEKQTMLDTCVTTLAITEPKDRSAVLETMFLSSTSERDHQANIQNGKPRGWIALGASISGVAALAAVVVALMIRRNKRLTAENETLLNMIRFREQRT